MYRAIMKKYKILICVAVAMFLINGMVFARQRGDIYGSQDHPLISRYKGSEIINYNVKKMDEYHLIMGNLRFGDSPKLKRVLGKVTRIQYRAPEDTSTLDIYLNYESALKAAGFQILYSGSGYDLGMNDVLNIIWGQDFEERFNLFSHASQQRYLAAHMAAPQGDIYVSLYVAQGKHDYPVFQLDIIEARPAETGMVTVVNPISLAELMAKDGHVAIYSIYFDFDKAEIKPGSETALATIASFLKEKEDGKFFVVGHTDNQGPIDYNMDLSMRRAQAVVDSLVNEYGIASDRLQPIGVGPVSPVESNNSEEGRSRNRRVELVER
jgi:OOP family OmpA-OmpF porin